MVEPQPLPDSSTAATDVPATASRILEVEAADGHRFQLITRVPSNPHARLLWLPALGVSARHYIPFADALAERGVAVYLHEWRGSGSSSLRASRSVDWGYRQLLAVDLPASETALAVDAGAPLDTIGGHSLGGQLASCRLALRIEHGEHPDAMAQRLWLVASGAPYWRAFPRPTRYWLPLAYQFLRWLARVNGTLPGRRVGFGGEEARGVIADWARTALSGRYAGRGIDHDLEIGLAKVAADITAVNLTDDWLGPPSSLAFLTAKLRASTARLHLIDQDTLGARADHFSWMKQPQPVADRLTLALAQGRG